MEESFETEEEFLAAYDPGKWPHPALTCDIALFRPAGEGLQVLMIKRGNHPFRGCWALPGGFCEPGENAHEAAARELLEETGASGVALEAVGFYSEPGRDPRDWVVTRSFVGVAEPLFEACAGDDACEARWFDLSFALASDGSFALVLSAGEERLACTFSIEREPLSLRPYASVSDSAGFAFDHARIVADAYLFVRTALARESEVAS